ncbi:hypothetical protein MMC20_005115 [Loxospora ochrophaea]|nr:hypothetical protein [Loxospora ochrophaea]
MYIPSNLLVSLLPALALLNEAAGYALPGEPVVRKRQSVDTTDDGDGITDAATGPLRTAIDYRSVYTVQPTVTCFTTGPNVSPAAPPAAQGSNYHVDHILELQLVVSYFSGAAPTGVPSSAWSSASSAVNTAGASNLAIASALSNLNNLQGIPGRVNLLKAQAFQGVLNGNPNQPNPGSFLTYQATAVAKNLVDNQAMITNTVIPSVGAALQTAGAGNVQISSGFSSYAVNQYSSIIARLEGFQGQAASPTTTAPPPSFTCEHEADPDGAEGFCPAVAATGWCVCNESLTYGIETGSNPCGYTTPPPTGTTVLQSTDCSTSTVTVVPVPATTTAAATTTACVVPAGCTNEAAPSGCAIACS